MLGTAALTAKIYVSSIVFYVYVTGMSLGLSTAILMGWMTGAKEYEKAYRLNQQVLKIAVSLNIVLSVLIFLCHRPLMHLFTQSEEIIGMTGVIFLSIFCGNRACIQPCRGQFAPGSGGCVLSDGHRRDFLLGRQHFVCISAWDTP